MFSGYFTNTIHDKRTMQNEIATTNQPHNKVLEEYNQIITNNNFYNRNQNYYVFGLKMYPKKEVYSQTIQYNYQEHTVPIIDRINAELLKTRPIKFIMKFFVKD